jgi:hypothetical protein
MGLPPGELAPCGFMSSARLSRVRGRRAKGIEPMKIVMAVIKP